MTGGKFCIIPEFGGKGSVCPDGIFVTTDHQMRAARIFPRCFKQMRRCPAGTPGAIIPAELHAALQIGVMQRSRTHHRPKFSRDGGP